MSEVPVLQVDRLVKHFPVSRGIIWRRQVGLVRAVEDVSFKIARGETLGGRVGLWQVDNWTSGAAA